MYICIYVLFAFCLGPFLRHTMRVTLGFKGFRMTQKRFYNGFHKGYDCSRVQGLGV